MINPLEKSVTTANSTPAFTPYTPKAPSMTFPVGAGLPQAPSAPVSPPLTGTPVSAVGVTATDPVGLYAPEVGPTTQKQADALYTQKIVDAASKSTTIPSTAIATGDTYATAGAKRSTMESLLEQYLNDQKDFQKKYLEASTPSSEETAASKRLADLKLQASLDEERALNSGETSAFAGGEAQRVNRTNAMRLTAAAADLERLQTYRTNAVATIEKLQSLGDNSFKTQLNIRKLQNEVSGIDKQAQDTFFNLAQSYPDATYSYDPSKSAVDNFKALQQAVTQAPSYRTAQARATKLATVGEGDGASTPKTLEERKAVTVKNYSAAFVPGAMYGDTPVFDPNGYITPKVWNAAIASGDLSRKDFIESFGYLLFVNKKTGEPDPAYKLTANEKALISK